MSLFEVPTSKKGTIHWAAMMDLEDEIVNKYKDITEEFDQFDDDENEGQLESIYDYLKSDFPTLEERHTILPAEEVYAPVRDINIRTDDSFIEAILEKVINYTFSHRECDVDVIDSFDIINKCQELSKFTHSQKVRVSALSLLLNIMTQETGDAQNPTDSSEFYEFLKETLSGSDDSWVTSAVLVLIANFAGLSEENEAMVMNDFSMEYFNEILASDQPDFVKRSAFKIIYQISKNCSDENVGSNIIQCVHSIIESEITCIYDTALMAIIKLMINNTTNIFTAYASGFQNVAAKLLHQNIPSCRTSCLLLVLIFLYSYDQTQTNSNGEQVDVKIVPSLHMNDLCDIMITGNDRSARISMQIFHLIAKKHPIYIRKVLASSFISTIYEIANSNVRYATKVSALHEFCYFIIKSEAFAERCIINGSIRHLLTCLDTYEDPREAIDILDAMEELFRVAFNDGAELLRRFVRHFVNAGGIEALDNLEGTYSDCEDVTNRINSIRDVYVNEINECDVGSDSGDPGDDN